MAGNGSILEIGIDPVEGKDRCDDAGTPMRGLKEATSRRRMLSAVKSASVLTLSIFIGLFVWEVVARMADNPLIIVAPSEVGGRIFSMVISGAIWPHVLASMSAFLCGFAAALVLGISLGLVLSETELLRTMLDPWLDALYATPMIVFAPIFIVSMGIGVTSKAAVVFLVSFFPIVITTVTGARLVEPKLLDMGRAFGFSRAQITCKIRAPFALPTIIAGLRVASARGLVGVVVAEMFGSRAGLGYLIVASNQNFDTVGMFAGGVVLIVFGVLINAFFRWLERYLAPWKVSHK
jgi:NitT/TauT family transport system permease protein